MSAVELEPELDPRLVEAAVLAAMRGHRREREFHVEREAVYEVADPERREAAFQALHARWFARIGLDAPLRAALGEHPEVARACARWLVVPARSGRDEGGDVLVAPVAGRTLVVRARPGTVAAPERLLGLLRRELLHVADMLDPAFGYDPALPPDLDAGPRAHVVRDRYRVLWNCYVDGRLLRRGMLAAPVRQERLAEFDRAFPRLGAATAAAFATFFDGAALTHATLLTFAAAGGDGPPPAHAAPSTAC